MKCLFACGLYVQRIVGMESCQYRTFSEGVGSCRKGGSGGEYPPLNAFEDEYVRTACDEAMRCTSGRSAFVGTDAIVDRLRVRAVGAHC
jgi:hypothetical protein